MASACVNNIGVPPENFPVTHSSFGWLSHRVSFSREDSKISKTSTVGNPSEKKVDLEGSGDFEFGRVDDPAVMLPADELFSDGKLMPLQLKTTPLEEVPAKSGRKSDVDLRFIANDDSYVFSPKAPRCSSRWRELLGLKKQQHNNKSETPKTTSSSASSTSTKSIRLFLYRNTKTTSSSSASDSSLSLPLLNPSDCDSLSISSSRLSLSSTSSSTHDDLPRHSLDTPNPNPNPTRLRAVRSSPRTGRSPVRRSVQPDPRTVRERGVSVDSPRLNSSGRVLFQSLERSSSSPSSFNNGGRPRNNNSYNYRGMERSYSANVVRVSPVLNVPVCSSLRGSSKSGSVFGFGQLFSSSTSATSQKKDSATNNGCGKIKKESS